MTLNTIFWKDKSMLLVILLALTNCLIGVMVVGSLIMTFFYLNPAIEFKNSPFPTNKSVYHPGETIIVFSETCRYTNIPSTTTMELRDGEVVFLPPVRRPGRQTGCYSHWTPVAKIPDHYPESKDVVLYGKVEIDVNSFIKRVAEWQTQPFEVAAH